MISLENLLPILFGNTALSGSDPHPETVFAPQYRDELDACVSELQHWQRELEHREQNMERRKNRLFHREQELEKKQCSIVQREQALGRREQQLIQQEELLDKQQRRLASQKAALDDAAARYQRERRQLEGLLPARDESSSSVEAELGSIREHYKQIAAELVNTRNTLNLLNTTINHSYRNGLTRLCSLYRDLSFSEQKELRLHADHLAALLQYEFNVESLDPCPGEVYDSTIHERDDISHMGDRVRCCRARGWKWNGEVLMRAVVNTEERNDDE